MKTFSFRGRLSRYLHRETPVYAPCECQVSKYPPKFNTGRSSQKHVLQIFNTQWEGIQEQFFKTQDPSKRAALMQKFAEYNMPADFLQLVMELGRTIKTFPYRCPLWHRVEDAVPAGIWVQRGEKLFRHGIVAADIKIPDDLTRYLEPNYPATVQIYEWPGAALGPRQIMQARFVEFRDLEPYDPYMPDWARRSVYTTRLAIDDCPAYALDTEVVATLHFPMLSDDYKVPPEITLGPQHA